ncbi:hypothetical protein F4779DRAFT_609740 [Xylariaceae sp. FL0662B]|nr:hypothetical protein F4779DRAFT_609740 [Xylariaceae sp. FL0662B]
MFPTTGHQPRNKYSSFWFVRRKVARLSKQHPVGVDLRNIAAALQDLSKASNSQQSNKSQLEDEATYGSYPGRRGPSLPTADVTVTSGPQSADEGGDTAPELSLQAVLDNLENPQPLLGRSVPGFSNTSSSRRKRRPGDLNMEAAASFAPGLESQKTNTTPSQPIHHAMAQPGGTWAMPDTETAGDRINPVTPRNFLATSLPAPPGGDVGDKKVIFASQLPRIPEGVVNISDTFGLITPKTALTARFPTTPTTASTTSSKLASSRVERIGRAIDKGKSKRPGPRPLDLIARLSQITELIVEVGKHLEPSDILTLYSVSPAFHATINTYLTSSIRAWAFAMAPESASIFRHQLYYDLCLNDPAGRQLPGSVPGSPGVARLAPSLKWLQMVVNRDDAARDILAHLARAGLRTPRDTRVAVLKMWLLMDMPHTWTRVAVARNADFFTNVDLLNAQLFFVKLAMLFNDPIYGPDGCELLKLFSAQRGWYPLWQMLFGHRYRTTHELLQLRVRYNPANLAPSAQYQNEPILGVSATEVGKGGLEGWGRAKISLIRPEELVAMESTRRDLRLDTHLLHLVIWGHLDQATGRNLAPSKSEIYMSDAGYKNRSIDTTGEYTETDCDKNRWHSLSDAQRQEIIHQDGLFEDYINHHDEYHISSSESDDAESEPEHELQPGDLGQLALPASSVDKNAEGSETPIQNRHFWGPSLARSKISEKHKSRNKTKDEVHARGEPTDGGDGSIWDSSDDTISVSSITSHWSTLSEPWRPDETHLPQPTHLHGFPPKANLNDLSDSEDSDMEEIRLPDEDTGWGLNVLDWPISSGFDRE